MTQEIPQLNFLLSEVERKIDHKLSTPLDFEMLVHRLEEEVHETISMSTVKRLWGYVSSNPMPRTHTLDILSRYLGYRDFSAFCKGIVDNAKTESTFFTTKYVSSKAMTPGQKIRLSWNPDRIVTLEYLGDSLFKVVKSINSKLREGDEFEQSVIMVGCPMFLAGIRRDGKMTDSFTAGSKNGITGIEIA